MVAKSRTRLQIAAAMLGRASALSPNSRGPCKARPYQKCEACGHGIVLHRKGMCAAKGGCSCVRSGKAQERPATVQDGQLVDVGGVTYRIPKPEDRHE